MRRRDLAGILAGLVLGTVGPEILRPLRGYAQAVSPTATACPASSLSDPVATRAAATPIALQSIVFGETIRAREPGPNGGDPGATGETREGPWDFVISGAEDVASIGRYTPRGRYVVVYATLVSHSRTSGTAGDGRYVQISDAQGRRYPPLYTVLYDLREPLGLLTPPDPVWPDVPFDTAWAYDLPPDATGLRLVLPAGLNAVLDLGLG